MPIHGEEGPTGAVLDGYGADGSGCTAIVLVLMQKCIRGSSGPPAPTLQSHARVLPPSDCKLGIYRGTNIDAKDLHRRGASGRG